MAIFVIEPIASINMSYSISIEVSELQDLRDHEILSGIQGLIDIVVAKFIKAGKFDYQERDDVKQSVNEILIQKMPKIKAQYKGVSLFRTYLTTVINNICFELMRKSMKQIQTAELNPSIVSHDADISPEAKLIIEQEVKKIAFILKLFHSKRSKLELCLKLRYRIPFAFKDFYLYNQDIKVKEFEKFLKEITPYLKASDLVIYKSILSIFNQCENKRNTSDALRKWVKYKINEIKNLLNGTPPTSNYTEETIQILFEKYLNSKNLEK